MIYRLGERTKRRHKGRNALIVALLLLTGTSLGLAGTGQSVLGRHWGSGRLGWPWQGWSAYFGDDTQNVDDPSERNQADSKSRKSKLNPNRNAPKTIPGVSFDIRVAGQWSYLPGSNRAADGTLTILPTPFAIVEQNGSGGQANPPVNLYGTRLDVYGDFELAFGLRGTADTTASVQLYGSVPIIADEFRIEGRSVRLSLKNGTLTASTWNGSSQTPAQTSFSYTPADNLELLVTRSGSQLTFTVNDQVVGSISEASVFKGGTLWFGMDAAGGNGWDLTGLNVTGMAAAHDTTGAAQIARDPASLQGLLDKKRPGLVIGAAMALGPLTADEQYRKTALSNFGAMTTENALKWQFVHPTQGAYDFHEADALVAIAQQHGLAVHAHTLVFAEANPAWVTALPASQREAAMLDHIKTVAGHYKGKVASWDVINEPFDDENWSSLRPHVWYQAMGDSYIPKALQAARQADPSAKLFINEYGIEEDGDRWNAMLALVTKLKQQGVPLDGVGFQSHVYASTDKINPTVLRKHFQQLAAIGLSARVSEIDVYSEDGQQVQADQFQQVLGACLAEPNCVSYTTWGVSDRYDWFKDEGTIEQGQDFLWDKNMLPTPAVAALRQLLQ